MRLAGLQIVVTGSSSGIGRAIALACARAGADITIHYATGREAAEQAAAEVRALGRRAYVAQADIAQADDVQRLVDEAHAAHGRIDVWVNNAGADILTGAAATWSPEQRLDLLLAVDVRGTFLCCKTVAPLMRRQAGGGQIINMAWDHVVSGLGTEEGELFGAAKGAIWGFSKSLARSLAPSVRVNVLAPGWIETSFAVDLNSSRRAEVSDSTPLGRWGTPDDVAGAAVFLASPAAAFITGQTIMVGGGVVMN